MDLIFWHIAKDEENYCLYNGSAVDSIYRLKPIISIKVWCLSAWLIKIF